MLGVYLAQVSVQLIMSLVIASMLVRFIPTLAVLNFVYYYPTKNLNIHYIMNDVVVDLVSVEIVSEGSPVLGSSGYTVQCNAIQFPWNSQLLRYRWNNTDGQLMSDSDSRLNITLLNATYDADDRVFVFNSSVQFNPLSYQDAGYITCGLALNLTFPDGPEIGRAHV